MAAQVQFFRWWIVDEVSNKERLTRFHMDEATAQERYPGCRPEPNTRELRNVYGPGEAPTNTLPGKS